MDRDHNGPPWPRWDVPLAPILTTCRDRSGSRRTETDDDAADGGELASSHGRHAEMFRVGTLVDPALAPLLERSASPHSSGTRAPEDPALERLREHVRPVRRTAPREILLVARPHFPVAEHRLRRISPELAAAASLHRLAQPIDVRIRRHPLLRAGPFLVHAGTLRPARRTAQTLVRPAARGIVRARSRSGRRSRVGDRSCAHHLHRDAQRHRHRAPDRARRRQHAVGEMRGGELGIEGTVHSDAPPPCQRERERERRPPDPAGRIGQHARDGCRGRYAGAATRASTRR